MCFKEGFFVTLFGMRLIDSIIAEIFSAIVVLSHNGSVIIEASLRSRVLISRSTMPVALWSCVGEKISFMFLFLQKRSKDLALITANAAWDAVEFAVFLNKAQGGGRIAIGVYCSRGV